MRCLLLVVIGHILQLCVVTHNTVLVGLNFKFDRKKDVETRDLEFLDIFGMHALSALVKVGVLK